MKRKDIPTKLVIQSCLKAHQPGEHRVSWEIIHEKTNAPDKVIYAAMQRDVDKGYLEFGVSINTAWATKKGIIYLWG